MNAERARRVLEERARLLARPATTETRAADEIEIAVCTVGQEAYGFPVQRLREIVPLPALTALPFAPECLLGITQVRGALLSVFDLGRLSESKGERSRAHLVVVDAAEGPIGFCVDEVLQCRHVSPLALTQAGSGQSERRMALGVTADLVVVLDIQKLLELPELVIE